MYVINFLSIGTGLLLILILLYMVCVSLREEEYRAAKRALLMAILLPLPYIIIGLSSFSYQPIIAVPLLSLTVLAVIIVSIPWKSKKRTEDNDTPSSRVDERNIMFSRRLLVEGSERFNDYYRRNPDKKALDDQFREKAGLLKEGSIYHDTYIFSAAQASFTAVEAFHPTLERNPPNKSQTDADPKKISLFIKQWATKLGSVSVGITRLRDYHLYSMIGRGDQYGQPVDLKHEFAIAITVEMDKYMLDRAPLGPVVMESSQQYLISGAIAVQIAEFIRNLGYPARAHIDGNYRVICPLVARDAGLGEIGRMGLLMTPQLGPRVRVAVVTTDLPLIPDIRKQDFSMIDFCEICQKCADACPAQAIPFKDRIEKDGVKRWQINSEACFTYWCIAGTDCGRCVRVCPYSHPDSMMHNFVRKGVRRSSLFRKLALRMDDFFYGRIPAPSSIPRWMDLKL